MSVEQVRAEVFRLRARPEDVGRDGLDVEDRGEGNVVIQCRSGRDFYWFGTAEEAVDRLSGLPDAGSLEAIRSEFGGG